MSEAVIHFYLGLLYCAGVWGIMCGFVNLGKWSARRDNTRERLDDLEKRVSKIEHGV